MNLETARQYLPLYRPGKPMDPKILKAVRYAECHESLREELGWQMDFDDQIVEVIHFIRPPENLRQKLSDLSKQLTPGRKPVRKNLLNPAILSAIVGVLLLLGFGVYLKLESEKDFPGKKWATDLLELNDKMNGSELDATKLPAGQLTDNMMLRGFERFALPPELNELPAIGWRVFRFSGNKVAQVAIEKSGTGGESRGLVVFVFRASDFAVRPGPEGTWKVFDHEHWAAAATEHGGLCTLLCFHGTTQDMEDLLRTLKKP